jgi:hypothetical protein
VRRERIFATMCTPAGYRAPDARWDTWRICEFAEIHGFDGLQYWHTWQVSVLDIGNGNRAAITSTFGKLAGTDDYVFFAAESSHERYEVVQNVCASQNVVSGFALKDYPLTEGDILHKGKAAFSPHRLADQDRARRPCDGSARQRRSAHSAAAISVSKPASRPYGDSAGTGAGGRAHAGALTRSLQVSKA